MVTLSSRATVTLLASAALLAPAGAQVVYSTDFTDLSGWATTDVVSGFEWRADATPASGLACGAAPFLSAPASLNFNNGSTFGPSNGGVGGTAISPVIVLDPAQPSARATFWFSIDHEIGCGLDWTRFEVIDSNTQEVLSGRCIPSPVALEDCGWSQARVSLDPAWGSIQLRFSTGASDGIQNDGRGPFIDDLVVEYACGADAEFVCLGSASNAYPWVFGIFGGARLDADGSPSISGGVVNVHAERIRGPGFALLISGGGPFTTTSIGNGVLCMPLSTVRRVGLGMIDPATDTVDWSLPIGVPGTALGAVAPGDTLVFQGWYRDVTDGNLTDAVSVRFCP
ncbi:MAG: hypothetical protein AAF726_11020 [Planctomycetota bacterium]